MALGLEAIAKERTVWGGWARKLRVSAAGGNRLRVVAGGGNGGGCWGLIRLRVEPIAGGDGWAAQWQRGGGDAW